MVWKTADLEPAAPASSKETQLLHHKQNFTCQGQVLHSNAVYHELAMSDQGLLRSRQIEKQIKEINLRWEVTNPPKGNTECKFL